MKDIYIGDTGKGTPLVLIHGFLCSSRMWELQINFFKKIICFPFKPLLAPANFLTNKINQTN